MPAGGRARGARGARGGGAGGAWASLGVPRGSPAAEVRRAYRRRARELHPDVNRAPDAAEQFVALQQAYAQCLREAAGSAGARAGAERPGGSGTRANPTPAWSGSRADAGGAPRRPAEPEEPFYGLGDLFRDLEDDARAARASAAGATGGAPRSSFEELGTIAGGLADELIEFLEEQAGLRPSPGEGDGTQGRPQPGQRQGGGSGPRAGPGPGSFDGSGTTERPVSAGGAGRGAGSPGRARERPAQASPRSPPKNAPGATRRPQSFESLEVEEELQKLKREMGID